MQQGLMLSKLQLVHEHIISVQFSSFCFDNPGNAASPMQRKFSCRSWVDLCGICYHNFS